MVSCFVAPAPANTACVQHTQGSLHQPPRRLLPACLSSPYPANELPPHPPTHTPSPPYPTTHHLTPLLQDLL
jgi:hypothetical protein